MSLLQDKALIAWTSNAVPASLLAYPSHGKCSNKPCSPILHTLIDNIIKHGNNYTKFGNVLHSRPPITCALSIPLCNEQANQSCQLQTNIGLFFHSGLLSSFKEKCVTNPTTGMFWTDLHALQGHVIAMQTHGNLKQVELVPKTHTSMNNARSFKTKRFNAMHRTQRTETRPLTPQRKRNARLLTCRSNRKPREIRFPGG